MEATTTSASGDQDSLVQEQPSEEHPTKEVQEQPQSTGRPVALTRFFLPEMNHPRWLSLISSALGR